MHALPRRARLRLVLASTVVAALAALAPAGPAAAQDAGHGYSPGTISFDLRGGIVPTASDFADVTDVGASAGGGLAVKLTRQVALQADVNYELFSGSRAAAGTFFPDVTVIQATGGLEMQFLPDDPNDSLDQHARAGGRDLQVRDRRNTGRRRRLCSIHRPQRLRGDGHDGAGLLGRPSRHGVRGAPNLRGVHGP